MWRKVVAFSIRSTTFDLKAEIGQKFILIINTDLPHYQNLPESETG